MGEGGSDLHSANLYSRRPPISFPCHKWRPGVCNPPPLIEQLNGDTVPGIRVCALNVNAANLSSMKSLLVGIVVGILFGFAASGLIAGAAEQPGKLETFETFDQKLATMREHLAVCKYPLAHVQAFAQENHIQDELLLAYAPKGIDLEKGRTD